MSRGCKTSNSLQLEGCNKYTIVYLCASGFNKQTHFNKFDNSFVERFIELPRFPVPIEAILCAARHAGVLVLNEAHQRVS